MTRKPWLLLLLGASSLTALLHGDEPRAQYISPAPQAQPAPAPEAPIPQRPRLTPSQAVTTALADVRTLPIDAQQSVAYLWVGAIDLASMDRFARIFTFHVNGLSRESDLIAPRQVHPDLWRVDLRDYGWRKDVWNKLAQVDPYFHVKLQAVLVPAVIAVGVQVQTVHKCQACVWGQQTKIWGELDAGTQFTVRAIDGDLVQFNSDVGQLGIRAADVQIIQGSAGSGQKNIAASAPWLPAQPMAELILLTQNEAPLLRADWFFVQTARQIDLNNQQVVGYYDFLNIKTEKDVEELAGLDRKLAEKLRRELRAIITDSGVTLHNRQIAAVQDGYWESLDVDRNDGTSNAKRQLDNDYKPIAKETYFRLPNGLWGLAAINAANGQLAASVPDSIASDKRTTSNDARIHPNLSCVRCHVEGLRPLDDWARQFYADPPGDAKLISPDYERLKRLRQLYLRPMEDRYEDDQRVYARTLLRLTGLTPKQLADGYAAVWSAYVDAPVNGAKLSAELGVGYDLMIAALRRYVAPVSAGGGGSQDPVLIDFLKQPEMPNRREYIEESYVLFQLAMMRQEKR